MRLTITLQNEHQQIIELLPGELVLQPDTDLSGFQLLRYLDPYGDTIFNRNQVEDLLTDLRQLAEVADNPVISQLVSLAGKCRSEVHTYLCFGGD